MYDNHVQLEILKELLFHPAANFAELDHGIGSNLVAYHLKKLLDGDFVTKTHERYALTSKGKEFASMIDTWEQEAVIHKQGKNRAVIILFKGKLGKSELVVQTRLKHPFFNFFGFPVEKVQFGETTLAAAQRCMQRETGLKSQLTFRGTSHKILLEKDKLVEDSYFFIYTAENVTGKLNQEGEGLKNTWMTPEEFLQLDKVYEGTKDVFKRAISGGDIFWLEQTYQVKDF